MGNCRDCKHWASTAWDEGELVPIVDSAGRAACVAVGTTRERPDEEPDEHAVVVAFGMGDCLLRTRGDFGCVLFEWRDEGVRKNAEAEMLAKMKAELVDRSRALSAIRENARNRNG